MEGEQNSIRKLQINAGSNGRSEWGNVLCDGKGCGVTFHEI